MDSPRSQSKPTSETLGRPSASNISISSADLKSRHVQISTYSEPSSTRTRTVKDSVINLKTLSTLSDEESEESISLHPTSFWELVIHRWKTLVGIGILAMPYAFSHSGWLVGILSVIFVTAGFRYCFFACMNIVDKVNSTNSINNDKKIRFPETMGIAFGLGPVYIKWLQRPWKYIWMVLYSILMVGIGGVYILFIALNMAQIFRDIDTNWSIRIWILFVYGAMILVSAIPNLGRIVPFTIIAGLLQSIGLILTMYFLFTNLPPITDRNISRPIEEYSIFIGIACFACGPKNFIFLMDLKTRFISASVNSSAIISTLIYSLVGFFGYWKYGNETLPSITLNLPTMWEFPEWIRLLFIFGIFMIYINNLHNFVYPIWSGYISPRLRLSPIWKQCCRYLIRFIFVTLTMALVMAIPCLGFLVSTIAIFTNVLFGLVFVPLAELSCFWPDELGRYNWIAVRNITITVIGLITSIFGVLNNTRILCMSLQYRKEFNLFPSSANITSRSSTFSC